MELHLLFPVISLRYQKHFFGIKLVPDQHLLNESMQEGLRSQSSGKNAEKIIQTLVIIIMKTENTVLNIHLFELWVNGAVN